MDEIKLIEYLPTTYSTTFEDIFGRDDEAIENYLRPGMKIWYDELDHNWKEYTINYVRSGVMFLQHDDEKERPFFISSFCVHTMVPGTIYIDDLAEYYSKKYNIPVTDTKKNLRNAKWYDFNGQIKIEVV